MATPGIRLRALSGPARKFIETIHCWKEHKHSIYSAVLHVDYQGKRINLLDTPGTPDLIGQAIGCLPAVETVAIVVNAQSGIEVGTRRILEAAKDRNLPRAIIINKIDMPEVDLESLVERIRETFGPECLPINLPSGGGKSVVQPPPLAVG